MKKRTSDKMKFNLTIRRTAVLAALFGAIILGNSATATAAAVWSGCVKVTSVQDYRAYKPAPGIYLSVSPVIPGCNAGLNRVRVLRGKNGANAETEKAALAMGLFAMADGRGVTLFYDNATANCFVAIIAVGGYGGQCSR